MPNLDDDVQVGFVNNFGFSHTKIENLTSDAYTLATIAVDISSSVRDFEPELKKCIKNAIESLKNSPRVDNMLVRVLVFNHDVQEVHGFKLLSDINIDEYDNYIKAGGTTALYDTLVNTFDSSLDFAKKLTVAPYFYTVNSYDIIITDGENVGGVYSEDKAKHSFSARKKEEYLESTMTYLVGVNAKDTRIKDYLDKLKNNVGIDAFIAIDDATPKSMAKLAGFITSSSVSVSKSIGSGQSQIVSF